MKFVTKKEQERLMLLIYKAQKSALKDDFCSVTDYLCDIAGIVLTIDQLCTLKDKICE